MPATSKRAHLLEEVASYHVQWKQARTLHIMSQFLDNLPILPSSDAPSQANSDLSTSSSSSPSFLSSVSSPSSDISDYSGSPSLSTHSRHNSGSLEDFDHFEDCFLEQWDAQIQSLALFLLIAQVLKACPPVKKLGQLGLYLTNFRHDHLDWLHKKLRLYIAMGCQVSIYLRVLRSSTWSLLGVTSVTVSAWSNITYVFFFGICQGVARRDAWLPTGSS